MTWLLDSKALSNDQIPEKAIGFIYVITSPNGKRYLGRKMLHSTKTKVTKGVKKKIKAESDWRDYWSSSPYLLAMVEEKGKAGFKREIILFCITKAEMLYAEESLLYKTDALLSKDWINGNIRSKIFEKWFSENKNNFSSRLQQAKAIII